MAELNSAAIFNDFSSWKTKIEAYTWRKVATVFLCVSILPLLCSFKMLYAKIFLLSNKINVTPNVRMKNLEANNLRRYYECAQCVIYFCWPENEIYQVKIKLATVKKLKANISNISPSSDREFCGSEPAIFVRWF